MIKRTNYSLEYHLSKRYPDSIIAVQSRIMEILKDPVKCHHDGYLITNERDFYIMTDEQRRILRVMLNRLNRKDYMLDNMAALTLQTYHNSIERTLYFRIHLHQYGEGGKLYRAIQMGTYVCPVEDDILKMVGDIITYISKVDEENMALVIDAVNNAPQSLPYF